ncbi:cell envelope biogenesis protein TolA [Phaeobacter sp. J2-8]|uniref:cell envelope biogenesis protein TolA n=1 Tax=Phaeobacter sp. J2-8 TaxID=2931394 RepID=UPI001FD30550|nr:cell envelope biogenesis protein TolA [Phaeobacter sp. J2-8]MCJ7873004.1 cell envelope biogenesis protein TolA [Phaeobacter sp. J2-8]
MLPNMTFLGHRAHVGHYVSGAAHVGLIGWLLIGPLFEVEPLPFDVTSVTTISEAEYAALVGAATPPGSESETATPDSAPVIAEAPAEPVAPPTVEDPAPAVPTPEPPAPEPSPAPVETAPAPLAPEALPETPPPLPAPVSPPEVSPPAEPAPPAAEDVEIALPEVSPRPRPRPAPRVAPEPVAPPEPDVQIAEESQEAVVPDESETTAPPQEEQDATAQEEATSEIVTEADEAPSGAPERTIRPRSRPSNLAAAAPATPQTPAAPPAAQPADTTTPATPAPTARETTADAVNDALAEALGGTTTSAAPAGPPLTAGEREDLRVAVQQCWVVDVGSVASRVTVVVGMKMEETGRVVTSSLRMVSATGGDDAAARVAFDAARRAILRCQKDGFDLPQEKYDQWRDIEMTFNPENVGR